MKPEISISVRELVEYTLKSGDLEVGSFRGQSRAREGQKFHKKIQNSRPENYQQEVQVKTQYETENLIIQINGRIDGVLLDGDRVLIDEIKTINSGLSGTLKKENILHWGQVKLYAYIYAGEYNLSQITTQLTYYELQSGRTEEVLKEYTYMELEDFFHDIIRKYIYWIEKILVWEGRRDSSLIELKFPFTNYRKGQKELAVSVYKAVRRSGQSLIQAPTGIGKTVATLFPAFKAMGEGHSGKIFFLTARTTGKMAAVTALDQLLNNGAQLKFVVLTAKEKICFKPGEECNPEVCEFARNYYDKIKSAREEIFQYNCFTRDLIEDISKKYEVCPFEFSLDISLWSDCIVGDYNYAFDPRTKLKRFFGEDQVKKKSTFTFLIDEAHNLVDRSREMFSAELTKQQFLDVRRSLKNDLIYIHKAMGKINSWFLKRRKELLKDKADINEDVSPVSLVQLLSRFLIMTEKWLSHNIKTAYRNELLDLYFSVHRFLRIAENFDKNYTVCYQKNNSDMKLKLFCLNPAEQLREALLASGAAVFFSATLTPMEYFRDILGCDDDAFRFILPSPFPKENLQVILDDNISTRFKHRDKTLPDIVELITAYLDLNKGNFLIFFPSYEYMNKVVDLIKSLKPEIDYLVQTSGMTEPERDDFIASFSHDNPRTTVGFAVMGGVFGEGIDLIGNRLDGAVIIGVGLPGLGFERDLIRDFFQQVGKGFEYAYKYPGITRVLQAAGRVIRTETDKGIILLIDDRFNNYGYRILLPEEWRIKRFKKGKKLKEIIS